MSNFPPLRFFPQDATTFGEFGRQNVAITTHGTEKPARAKFLVRDEAIERAGYVIEAWYDRAFRKWQVSVRPISTYAADWTMTITTCPLGVILEIDAPPGAVVQGEITSP